MLINPLLSLLIGSAREWTNDNLLFLAVSRLPRFPGESGQAFTVR